MMSDVLGLVCCGMELCGTTHLSGSVNDVTIILDTVVFDVLGEGVLDGRVVRVDEGVVDVLHDERGFTCWDIGVRSCAVGLAGLYLLTD